MSTNWIGPRRGYSIFSDFTVELGNLLTGTTAFVHVCRVNSYADALVGTKAQMKDVAEFTDRIWYAVDKIIDIREAATASKFSLAGKDIILLEIPRSRSPSCLKMVPPRFATSSSTAI